MPTDEASVNVTRARLGRLTSQGFLAQPGAWYQRGAEAGDLLALSS